MIRWELARLGVHKAATARRLTREGLYKKTRRFDIEGLVLTLPEGIDN